MNEALAEFDDAIDSVVAEHPDAEMQLITLQRLCARSRHARRRHEPFPANPAGEVSCIMRSRWRSLRKSRSRPCRAPILHMDTTGC
jgi:hypothetical protein